MSHVSPLGRSQAPRPVWPPPLSARSLSPAQPILDVKYTIFIASSSLRSPLPAASLHRELISRQSNFTLTQYLTGLFMRVWCLLLHNTWPPPDIIMFRRPLPTPRTIARSRTSRPRPPGTRAPRPRGCSPSTSPSSSTTPPPPPRPPRGSTLRQLGPGPRSSPRCPGQAPGITTARGPGTSHIIWRGTTHPILTQPTCRLQVRARERINMILRQNLNFNLFSGLEATQESVKDLYWPTF